MDVEHVSRLGFSGNTLNVEERAGLEVAMMKRAEEEGMGRLLFWGKVGGTRGSYLVCCGLRQKAEAQVPVKKFYYWCAPPRGLGARHGARPFTRRYLALPRAGPG